MTSRFADRIAHVAVAHAVATLTSVAFAASLGAQPVVIRTLATPDARSAMRFGSVLNVRALPGGKLLVNDGARRQVSLLEATFATRTIVIDSVAIGGQGYGAFATPLIPYLGDSTLFVDGGSSSLVVMAPNGSIARVMAAPRPSDIRYLASSGSGVDARGNLVYRGVFVNMRTEPLNGSKTATVTFTPDSSPILRANFDTRSVDTLVRVRSSPGTRITAEEKSGRSVRVMLINPLWATDDWAVLADGSVAFVRGHDYHVDILHADGSMTNGPKLPFDWKRLSDEDKQALVDSVKLDRERVSAAAKAGALDPTGKASAVVTAPPQGFVVMKSALDGTRDAGIANPITLTTEFVPLKEIADYWPPIRAGAARADADGKLWILPTTSAQSQNGELVYDVVSNRGVLVERVRIPAGRSIAGFGKGGVVYLMTRDADGWTLERTRVVTTAASQ